MEGFFDEKSGKWLKIFKGFIIVEFWLMVAAAVVLCFAGWAGALYWTGSGFIDGIIVLVSGCVGAVIFLVPNMLILQLLNNVQIIRKKAESVDVLKNDSPPKPVTKKSVAPVHNHSEPAKTDVATHVEKTKPVEMIACPSCGKTQFSNAKSCFNCGHIFE